MEEQEFDIRTPPLFENMTNVTFLPLYANGKTSLNLQQDFAHEQKSQMELNRDENSPNFPLSFDGGGV